MCAGNTDCGCGCASFDGTYNPEEIKNAINSNLLNTSGSESEVSDLYVKTMVYFEKNNIQPSPSSVSENKEELLELKNKSVEDIIQENNKTSELSKKSSLSKLISFLAIGFGIYIAIKWMSSENSQV